MSSTWIGSGVKVRFVTGKDAYKIAFKNEAPAQKEGASMSTTTFYERLRIAGAVAREALTRAAAEKWDVAVSGCRTERGFVISASGNRLSYGELAPQRAGFRSAPIRVSRSPTSSR